MPSPGSAASLSLAAVSKAYGGERVLADVDLDVRAGEFVALVGPSGCGKSTLLRLIAGLDTPDAGSIRIGERAVDHLRASERDIAMVFQSYALYPHLSVFDNIATPLRLRDLERHQRLPFVGPWLGRARHRALHEEVRNVAATLGLEPLLNRKPGMLSGGQRQRVALGRAIVRRPVAFLMDEPLSNLDATLRVAMRVELAELHRALGATFVYVTHDQAEALTMADRIAVMSEGRILQLAAPDAVYADPADLAVARFIGTPEINVLPGEIGRDGVVRVFGTPLTRADPQTASTATVRVGIRAEHLSFAHVGAPAGTVPQTSRTPFGWGGRVVHREHLGADVFVHVALGDGGRRVVVRTTPEEDTTRTLGAAARVAPHAGRVLVFDANGQRLRTAAGERDDPAPVARSAVGA